MALEQLSPNNPTPSVTFATLSSGINSAVTSLTVSSASFFPSVGQFRILIDSEYMLVTAVAGTTLTVTRGAESSTPASHLTGAKVIGVLTRGGLAQIVLDVLGDGVNSTNVTLNVPAGNLIQFQSAGTNALAFTLRATGATSAQLGSGVTSWTWNQASTAVNSATGATGTIQAQSATGTTAIGGELDVGGGTGTSRYGDLKFISPINISRFSQAMADAAQAPSAANSAANLIVTTGANTAYRALTLARTPSAGSLVFLDGQTTGFGVTVQFSSGTATPQIPPGAKAIVTSDGTNAQLLAVGGGNGVGTFAARPVSSIIGAKYYPTDGHLPYIYDGTLWRPLVAGSVVGTQPPSAASFTGVNQGGATIADSNGGLEIFGANDGATPTSRAFVLSAANSVDACIVPQYLPTIAANTFSCFGIMMRESGTGKMLSLTFTLAHASTGNPIQFEYNVWSANTTRTTNTVFSSVGSADAGSPLFLRIRRSGATMFAEYSRNRISWTTVNSVATTTAFTTAPDQAGIATMGFNIIPHGFITHFATT